INALIFEEHLLDNLFELRAALAEGSYSPSRSVCFIAKQPKHREIFAADFKDRVVHHLLVPKMEEIFEPKFIHDSFACRTNKGTHAAVARLRQFMNCITRQGKVTAWFLQLDIRSFFMSMDREILLTILARHLRDPHLLALAEKIVRNDCTRDFVYKGDPKLLQGIPPHKSMFHIPVGKGLPIGNLTSQFFGNVYLNELDQFVKHELKVKQYLRYVDDFVLLHTNREMLVYYRQRIEEFLSQRLALTLK
ncbi:group II intron reverse transcriptase domain-containing protein, partial [bacterium]|nr:group II intron reverse transcriptase domain-containing protein [bacterium]